MTFLRLLKYNSLFILRSKEGLFWTVLYPIILATLFVLAFSSSFNFTQNKISVGLEKDNPLYEAISYVPIFDIIEVEKENANNALRNKKIAGFINKDFSLYVLNDGIIETIIKSVLEEIKQTHTLGVRIDPAEHKKSYIKNVNEKNNETFILFYSLLAMVSMYGMFAASALPIIMQANLSKLGARISSTPMNRFVSYLSGIVFYTLFNIASNILYILFVTYVLKVTFITDFGTTIFILLIANIFGVAFGAFIGSLPFGDANLKSVFCVFSSLFLAFLSGMMGPQIKLALDKKIPILNKINPIGLLTDNLYNINILQEYSLIKLFLVVFLSISVLLLVAIFINSKKVKYKQLS